MSRVGREPVAIPDGVRVKVNGKTVDVSGPKGSLSIKTPSGIVIKQDDKTLNLSREGDELEQKARHGLTRSLINNMVVGVSEGFNKKLEIHGVGFRVSLSGDEIKLNIGFSHDVVYKLPDNISASVNQNTITISGIDKQQVGQVAAEIRSLKKPEPYKGKGIKYEGERIIRKSGKSGKEKAV